MRLQRTPPDASATAARPTPDGPASRMHLSSTPALKSGRDRQCYRQGSSTLNCIGGSVETLQKGDAVKPASRKRSCHRHRLGTRTSALSSNIRIRSCVRQRPRELSRAQANQQEPAALLGLRDSGYRGPPK